MEGPFRQVVGGGVGIIEELAYGCSNMMEWGFARVGAVDVGWGSGFVLEFGCTAPFKLLG